MSHARRGRGWEARLQVWHAAYQKAGLAWVVQTGAKVKRVGSAGGDSFEAVYSGKGPPDFVGVIAGGVPVVFEAKECRSARWPLSQVADHQAAHLDRAHRLGAAAFIALRHDRQGWVLPWDAFAELQRAGVKSIGAVEIRALCTPMNDAGWLDAVLALAGEEAA